MRVIVYGSRADGHATVVIELFGQQAEYELIGLVDDHPENSRRSVCGLKVIGTRNDLCALADSGVEGVLLGFGAARGRADIIAAIEHAGLALPVLRHPSSHVSASASLSPGSQLLPGAAVGPGACIARGALVNTGAIVEHDVKVEQGAVINPGAVLTGRCVVGPESEIGAGAVVLPDVEVGSRAVVGAGAVVTRSVPPNTIVVGVPARVQPAQGRSATGQAED
jgi:UDP-perosamine 4-acetyltransferase